MSMLPLQERGPWLFAELPARDDLLEGYRYEVVDGNLVVSPPPSHRHQLAIASMVMQIGSAAPTGWLVAQDLGLQLGSDGRVPDLAVVRADAGAGEEPYPFGSEAFGLVGEVMSPSSRKTDLFAKPGEYAEAGIPIFWRLELDPSPRLHAFVLRGDGYVQVADIGTVGVAPVPWVSSRSACPRRPETVRPSGQTRRRGE